MRQLAVIAYPNIDPAEREWLETFRARHDPQAARLGLHFTLVFPFDEQYACSTKLSEEVCALTEPIPVIHFAISQVLAMPDARGNGGHVFLLPEPGRDAIAELHDRLYRGPFCRVPFENVPFLPHMTVAASSRFATCELLAQELTERATGICGALERLELVDVSEPIVRYLRSCSLRK